MKLTKLRIKKFLCIDDMKVNLGPGMNLVRGRNGSGKTSILEAIRKGLGGGRIDPSVVRIGDEEATADIMLELDGTTIVRRQIGSDGTRVSVTKKDGGFDDEKKQAQRWLSSLIGSLGLDPAAFYAANDAERRRILLSAVPAALTPRDVLETVKDCLATELSEVGMDVAALMAMLPPLPEAIGLADLGALEKRVMELRAGAYQRKELAEKAALAERAKLPDGYVHEDVPATDAVLANLEAANATVKAADDARHLMARMLAQRDRSKQEVERLEYELSRLSAKCDAAKEDLVNADRLLAESQEDLNKATDAVLDPEPIKATLRSLDERMRVSAASHLAESQELLAEQSAAVVKALDRTTRSGIRETLPAMLWSRIADSPLGKIRLSMVGDRLLVDGKDIDNLSESEKIRLALAIARATAGELKLICVDGIEALDKTTLAAFETEAKDDGYQYVVAQVADCDLEVVSK